MFNFRLCFDGCTFKKRFYVPPIFSYATPCGGHNLQLKLVLAQAPGKVEAEGVLSCCSRYYLSCTRIKQHFLNVGDKFAILGRENNVCL